MSNVKRLYREYTKHAKADVKAIVEEIIDLYGQGKIPLLATAEKLLDNITSLDKKKRDKGIEDFKKKKDSYYSPKSVIGRLEKEIKDFEDKDIKDFDIEYLAFVEVDEKVYNSIKSSQMRKKKMNGRFYKQSSSWLKALVKAPSPFPSSLYKKNTSLGLTRKASRTRCSKLCLPS